jgi:transcriptional regulator with XRE-family HTH domain
MASRETEMSDFPLSALASDINTDPKARAAWLEVAAARMAAQLMRNARKRSGLTQPELARALDLTQARISQIESGRTEDMPSLELLIRFVDACGDELVLSTAQAEEASTPRRRRRRDALSPTEQYRMAELELPTEAEDEEEAAVARPSLASD